LLTILISLLSYYFIEKPFRGKEGVKFYLPFALMVILNILMIYFVVPAKNKISNIPEEYAYPSFGKFSHGKDFKGVEVFGDTSYKGKKILFLGDSHALTFKPYLDKLGRDNGFSFRTITNDAYPAIPFIDYSDIIEPNRLEIYKRLEPNISKEVKEANVIVVYFAKDGKRWKKALQKLLASLKTDQKIIFISDYPEVDKNPVRANKDFLKDASKNKTYKLIQTNTSPEVLEIIKSHPNSRYVDMSEFKDFFKDAPFYKDTLMYYDASHLNKFGALRYADYSGSKLLETIIWAIK